MSWDRFRRQRKKLFIVWGAWFPFMLILILLTRAGVAVAPWLVLAVILPWAVVTAVLSLRVTYWPCPQCGKLFFLRFAFFPAGGKRCPHCGLPYGVDYQAHRS